MRLNFKIIFAKNILLANFVKIIQDPLKMPNTITKIIAQSQRGHWRDCATKKKKKHITPSKVGSSEFEESLWKSLSSLLFHLLFVLFEVRSLLCKTCSLTNNCTHKLVREHRLYSRTRKQWSSCRQGLFQISNFDVRRRLTVGERNFGV